MQGVMGAALNRRCELRVQCTASASRSSTEAASSVLSTSPESWIARVGRANSSTRHTPHHTHIPPYPHSKPTNTKTPHPFTPPLTLVSFCCRLSCCASRRCGVSVWRRSWRRAATPSDAASPTSRSTSTKTDATEVTEVKGQGRVPLHRRRILDRAGLG